MDNLIDGLTSLIGSHPFDGCKRDDFERLMLGDTYSEEAPDWSTGDPPNFVRFADICHQRLLSDESLDATDRELLYCIWCFWRMRDAMLSEHPSMMSRAWDSFNSQYARRVRREADPDHMSHLFSLIYQLRRMSHQLFTRMSGWSPVMSQLRSGIWRAVFSHRYSEYIEHTGIFDHLRDMFVLIGGPVGSGKNTIARAIGLSTYIPFNPESASFLMTPQQGFTAVNVATIPETLLETHLFGTARGAFPGAADSPGVLEGTSRWGVVYLDDIQEMSRQTQAKLLQVCDDRSFSRVGEPHVLRRFEGRLIVSSRANLHDMVTSGAIREDLYYRISSICIDAPTLYERLQSDSAELRQFVSHAIRRTLTGSEIYLDNEIDKCCDAIEQAVGPNYRWPGNVRELVMAVRRYATGFDIVPHAAASTTSLADALRDSTMTGAELLEEYTQIVYEKTGSVAATARHLGSDRRTIKDRLELGNSDTERVPR